MKTTLLELINQFEVNKGTKEVFDNFFFKATKSENSNDTFFWNLIRRPAMPRHPHSLVTSFQQLHIEKGFSDLIDSCMMRRLVVSSLITCHYAAWQDFFKGVHLSNHWQLPFISSSKDFCLNRNLSNEPLFVVSCKYV